jgi:integrase
MATFKKHKSGWQAQVARKGVRVSKILPTKREAQDWAARQEHLILQGKGQYGPGTLSDLLDRYAKTESPKKKGERWETLRLAKIAKDKIGAISLIDLQPGDFADWRDRRVKEVAPSSVRREMILLSAVMTTAVKEWKLLPSSPLADVRKPSNPPPRDRRVSQDEIDALVKAAGSDLSKSRARSVHAFRFAVETAMRAGEICGLTEDSIAGSVAFIPDTKNGEPRYVPLSTVALDLWAELPTNGFGLEPGTLDALFRRCRDDAGIENLTFHDSRHEAITRLSKRLDVLPLARMVGHKNVSQLMTYYNETPGDIAKLLG